MILIAGFTLRRAANPLPHAREWRRGLLWRNSRTRGKMLPAALVRCRTVRKNTWRYPGQSLPARQVLPDLLLPVSGMRVFGSDIKRFSWLLPRRERQGLPFVVSWKVHDSRGRICSSDQISFAPVLLEHHGSRERCPHTGLLAHVYGHFTGSITFAKARPPPHEHTPCQTTAIFPG
jgi:hypothetical protein